MIIKYFNIFNIYNSIIILSYIYIRSLFNKKFIEQIDWVGYNKEQTILFTLLFFLVIKYKSSICIEEFLSKLFFYAKLAIIILMLFGDIKFLHILYFILLAFGLHIVIKEPEINTLNYFIELNDHAIFEDLLNFKIKDKFNYEQNLNNKVYIENKKILNKNNFNDYKDNKYTFVVFYANFAYNCNYLNKIWNEFSLFKCNKLNFIRVDAEKFKIISKNNKINVSPFSKQLPTLILFKYDKEILRFPPINDEGKVAKVLKFDKKILLQYFKLKEIFLSSFIDK